MRLTRIFIAAALAFTATTALTQELPQNAVPQVDAVTRQDAQDIYNRLSPMRDKTPYRTDEEYEARDRSDRCAAGKIALLNEYSRKVETSIAAQKISKAETERLLTEWRGRVTGQALTIMLACDLVAK